MTWFHYGHPQRVEIETAEGIVKAVPLSAEGLLPDSLGVPVETVKGLHCYLANESLKDVTLVDTPGLGSVHADFSASTTDLLALGENSSEAAQRADAIVFLFNQAVMQDDYAALQLFKGAGGPDTLQSAANAVGVLSKADQLGDPMGDPWAVAVELADQYAGRFEAEVASVVPVIGLVAETSEAAALMERDVQHLAKLASMDDKAFNRLVWSADRFASAERARRAGGSRAAARPARHVRDQAGRGFHPGGGLRRDPVAARALRSVRHRPSEEVAESLPWPAGSRLESPLRRRDPAAPGVRSQRRPAKGYGGFPG